MRITTSFLLFFALVQPLSAATVNDPLFDKQWYLQNIHATKAWDFATGSRDVIVAVLDTGVDLDHKDLAKNIWTNGSEIAGDGIDNDRNGFVDDVHGYDFVDRDGDPEPDLSKTFDEDAVPHGTVVAGVIAAVGNNSEGIAGINWNASIMSVRILDDMGIGSSTAATEGIDYAVANGADVINLSFTGFDDDPRFRNSLKHAYQAGVMVVAAVGNGDDGEGINVDHRPIYPACYGENEDEDWILGVASTDRDDKKSNFSNYGALCTDISAPGEDILSTIFQTSSHPNFSQSFYASGWSGTSLAAPMVAGAAVLLKSKYPNITPNEIKSILRLSADPVLSSGDAKGKVGAGRLNLARALEVANSFIAGADLTVSSTIQTGKPSHRIAVASEQDTSSIRVLTKSGTFLYAFTAYDKAVGVRLAMGDVNGDGVEEIVTVPATGNFPVKIFSLEGKELDSFTPFDTFSSGLFVATGDMNKDGKEEIAVSQDAGDGLVGVFTSNGTRVTQFDPFETKGSTRVALGDVDGDGIDEIITTRGVGFEPTVRVYTSTGTFVKEFLAYAKTYDRGVFVSSGDLDGDGDDEIVTGTDKGGGPQVQIYDGSGKWLGTFFAYDKNFRGGVRLSVGNLSDSPGASIITAAGPGGGPHVRVFNGYAKLIGTFFANSESDRKGINSSAWGR